MNNIYFKKLVVSVGGLLCAGMLNQAQAQSLPMSSQQEPEALMIQPKNFPNAPAQTKTIESKPRSMSKTHAKQHVSRSHTHKKKYSTSVKPCAPVVVEATCTKPN